MLLPSPLPQETAQKQARSSLHLQENNFSTLQDDLRGMPNQRQDAQLRHNSTRKYANCRRLCLRNLLQEETGQTAEEEIVKKTFMMNGFI